MEIPLLTYIVPVYNTEPYVLRCLRSILDQGLNAEQYEVLVVDDGSTDGSRAVVETMANDYPQVRIITQANAGVSAARNLALSHARGRYVQFVDSDDYLEPGMMAALLERAALEDLDILLFNYECVDGDGKPLPHVRGDNYAATAVIDGVAYLESHVMTPYVWRFLISRDYLDRGQWRFDESLIVCEDGALIAHLLLNARRMAQADAAVYRYVKRPGSAMHSGDSGHLRRRIMSQVDSAALIDATIRDYEASAGKSAPISVAGLRNVYLYFALTKALMCGCVEPTIDRMRQAGLYPFPCVGPEANYHGMKWKLIHWPMMHPRLWQLLSKVYRIIKK